MFDNRELLLLHQVDSWEKVDEVGSAFFPKLMALKNKTTDLIFNIYGIDADQFYKTYQAPTPSKSQKKGLSSNQSATHRALVSAFALKTSHQLSTDPMESYVTCTLLT